MGLTIDVPLVTPGPDWAADIVENFQLLDVHDHTSSNGVRVPTAGININADLSFNSFNAIALRTIRLDNQTSTPSDVGDLRILYSKNGELAYRDGSGNEVVITNNGSIAGASGTISGLVSPASAVYSSITKSLTISADTGKLARFNISEISLYEFDNPTANPITIKTPAAVAAPYTMTLPGAPATTGKQLTLTDTSGVQTLSASQNGNGMVPIGGIIATFPNLTGAYSCTSSAIADPENGYILCNGATITDANSPMNGQVLPDLTSNIFLAGTTSTFVGATGGANLTDLSHVHDMASHVHSMYHVHQWGYADNINYALKSLSNADVTISTFTGNTQFAVKQTVQNGSGSNRDMFQASGLLADVPMYTGGVLNSPGGTANTAVTGTNSVTNTLGALSSSYDNRPSFINTLYIMRIW